MKLLLALACVVLASCGGSSNDPVNDVIFVEGVYDDCVTTNTVMAWDGDGQDFVITYCTCFVTYEYEGPQYCD